MLVTVIKPKRLVLKGLPQPGFCGPHVPIFSPPLSPLSAPLIQIWEVAYVISIRYLWVLETFSRNARGYKVQLLFKVLQLFQAPRRESVGMIRGRSSTDLGFILCSSWINMAWRWKYKPRVRACQHTRVWIRHSQFVKQGQVYRREQNVSLFCPLNQHPASNFTS